MIAINAEQAFTNIIFFLQGVNMLTMWNNRYLRAPPAATEKYDLKEIVKGTAWLDRFELI